LPEISSPSGAIAPIWFRLVQQYPNTRGPTIPFLLGALRTPPGAPREPETARMDLMALLLAIRDQTPEGYAVTIEPCPRIKQPVVVLQGYEPSIRIESPLGNGRGLNVHIGYCPDPSMGLESVAKELWELHARDIRAGRFSFHDGTFRAFDSEELANIAKAISLDRSTRSNDLGS